MEVNGKNQKERLQNRHKKVDKNLSLISIIIPMYNVEKCISNCIMAIMKQTYTNFEIITINDGSTDKTESICLQLSEKYSQIRYYYQTNLGAGAARNKGIELSRGEYLAFIDADDYVYPTYLEELYFLIKEFNVKISCCSYIKGLENNVNNFFKKKPVGNRVWLNREEALASLFYRKEITGYPYVKLINSNLTREIEFPINLRLGEDFTFVYEILNRVDKVAYTSKELYFYAQNQQGITHNLSAIDMKLWWQYISCKMLNETKNNSEIVKKAIRSKLFILACDFLVRLKNDKNEIEFRDKLIDYVKKNRKKIVRDKYCKKSNRLLGLLCCINVNMAINMGYLYTKMNWNLKKAL